MIDEGKLHRDAARGNRAQSLLNDELLSEAFKTLETTYIQKWAGTEAPETEAREHFWRAIQILGDVRKHLASVAANGKVAKKQLDQLGGLNRL